VTVAQQSDIWQAVLPHDRAHDLDYGGGVV